MAQVYNKLQIDVHGAIRGLATPVQNDANSRFLDVVLLDNGTAINLTGHEVRIYCKKPENGGEIYNNGEITDAVNGRCQFPLTDQTLAKVGYVEAQITIFYQNVQILQTHVFHINVVKSLMSESSIESSNEYGALVVLFQELYEAKDLMTTMVQNQGEKGVISEDRDIETFWQSMEYVSKYLDTDLTNLLNAVLAEANVQGVIDRLGNTADTGGSATAGTVMGKLNAALETVVLKKKTRRATISWPAQQAVPKNTVLLDIDGHGEFYAIHSSLITEVKFLVDGEEMISVNSANRGNVIYPTLYMGLTNGKTTDDNMLKGFAPITFTSSLKIINNASQTTSSSESQIVVAYALYE